MSKFTDRELKELRSLVSMPTYEMLQLFLGVHRIKPGTDLTFEQHSAIMGVFQDIWGNPAFAMLMDAWEPWGDAVEPGVEDSCQFYRFQGISREEWEDE